MGFANPKGRDWSSILNWDGLGKLYASIIVAWTAIILAGATYLTVYRNLYFLKIRNIPLAITSTFMLHLYLIKIFLAYTTNNHFPCGMVKLYFPHHPILQSTNPSNRSGVLGHGYISTFRYRLLPAEHCTDPQREQRTD
jgi:hypothetical protein